MPTSYSFHGYGIERKQLAESFDSFLTHSKSRIAIICGHFSLGYDVGSNKLLALIPEEENDLKERSKYEAGTFPLETFKIGVEMYNRSLLRGIEVKLLMLVNDSKVSSAFRKLNIPDTEAATLRRDFFKSREAIPRIYREILLENDLLQEMVFLKNVRMDREINSLLPPESYCWNEVSLQRKFNRFTSRWLVNKNALKITVLEDGQKEITYQSTVTLEDYCVFGKGQSGCVGIGMELIRQLNNVGINRIVFMVPTGCVGPIDLAAEISQHFVDGEMTIACVGGVEERRQNAIVKIHKINYDEE